MQKTQPTEVQHPPDSLRKQSGEDQIQAPMVSVIITTYKATDHLLCCVRSLSRTPVTKGFEVILYGDGGGADSEAALRQAQALLNEVNIPCVVKYHGQNLGICAALNRACSLARAPWLFIVNDDMVFPLDWLNPVRPHLVLGTALSVGLIEPLLPGRRSASFISRQTLGFNPNEFDFLELDLMQKKTAHAARLKKERGLVAGANYPFFIETNLWNELQGVDEGFLGPYHDPDLFLRLRNKGIRLVRFSGLELYHFSGVSLRFEGGSPTRSNKTKNWMEKEYKSRIYFIKKWGAKPKARFGEIPKTRALEPWSSKDRNFLEKFLLLMLLLFEIIRGRVRLLLN